MNLHETSLLATFKNVRDFGLKYVVDFPATSTGGKQFALITSATSQTSSLAATQASGGAQKTAGVRSKAATYKLLHDDLAGISRTAHSLALLGNAGIDGKFHMPRSGGDQALLTTARAFKTDVAPFSADMIELGLDTDFLTHLDTHISDFETAITAKGTGQSAQGGATSGIEDATHQAAIALHVIDTIVRNKYKADPAKLAEWTIASHVEKHTPAKRPEKPAVTAAPLN